MPWWHSRGKDQDPEPSPHHGGTHKTRTMSPPCGGGTHRVRTRTQSCPHAMVAVTAEDREPVPMPHWHSQDEDREPVPTLQWHSWDKD